MAEVNAGNETKGKRQMVNRVEESRMEKGK